MLKEKDGIPAISYKKGIAKFLQQRKNETCSSSRLRENTRLRLPPTLEKRNKKAAEHELQRNR